MSSGAPGAPGLARLFREHVLGAGVVREGDTVVVAVSGGRDSVVLLHLLCHTAGLPSLRLVAAHLDHAMRADSAADAEWVVALCAGWGVPACVRRADPAPSTEAGARRLRYAFLEEIRKEEGARVVVTAHHADDQAETVLFRAVRGTGLAGLQGIRARRAGGLWRPLLPFTRAEITAYATSAGLSWREDPTNDARTEGWAPARSVLRSRVLPELEGRVAPGAAQALAALARHARENEAAWGSLLPELLERADLKDEGEAFSLGRTALLALHPGVRARLIRALCRGLGYSPGEAGTRAAVEFTSSGSSGAFVPLGAGLELRRELDRLVLGPSGAATADVPLIIHGRERGEGEMRVGGRRYTVSWGPQPDRAPWTEAFDVAGLRFPLSLRGWAPGDRVHMAYGSKKLKKLFLELRVPSGERHRVPVLSDAAGAVLWVPGIARSVDARSEGAAELFHIGVRDAQPS